MIYRIPLTQLPAGAGAAGATFIVSVELRSLNPMRTYPEPKQWGFGPALPVDFDKGNGER